jgi:Uridine kinase
METNLPEKVVAAYARKYPLMSVCDAVKLCYQACFGAGHLLTDPQFARQWLEAEYATAIEKPAEALFEELPGGFARLNLGAAKRDGIPPDLVYKFFAASADLPDKSQVVKFKKLLDIVHTEAENATFTFSGAEFASYTANYFDEDAVPPPVSHSDIYRIAYSPSYRAVDARFIPLIDLCKAIYNLPQKRRNVIAIDGRCASGKTTAAQLIARAFDAEVVHCDDFYLPIELRTKERYAKPGGNIHYERFAQEVVAKLPSGEPFDYGIFDCSEWKVNRVARVGASPLVIVEGAYSTHPILGRYFDLSVFFDVKNDVRKSRIAIRDGKEALSMFEQKWIPLEEAYIAATKAIERADMIVEV